MRPASQRHVLLGTPPSQLDELLPAPCLPPTRPNRLIPPINSRDQLHRYGRRMGLTSSVIKRQEPRRAQSGPRRSRDGVVLREAPASDGQTRSPGLRHSSRSPHGSRSHGQRSSSSKGGDAVEAEGRDPSLKDPPPRERRAQPKRSESERERRRCRRRLGDQTTRAEALSCRARGSVAGELQGRKPSGNRSKSSPIPNAHPTRPEPLLGLQLLHAADHRMDEASDGEDLP